MAQFHGQFTVKVAELRERNKKDGVKKVQRSDCLCMGFQNDSDEEKDVGQMMGQDSVCVNG